jgi:uncharacterized protein
MSESNAATIREAYDNFAHGNIPAVFAAFDANITWHVLGHSPLSGDFPGHVQIGNFFRRTMELSGGAFSIDVQNVLADGDLFIVLAAVNAQRIGVSASFTEVQVWRMKNGKATDSVSVRATSRGKIGSGHEVCSCGESPLPIATRTRARWRQRCERLVLDDADRRKQTVNCSIGG